MPQALIAPLGRIAFKKLLPRRGAGDQYVAIEHALAQSLDREMNGENQVPADLQIAERILQDERRRLQHMIDERQRLQNEIAHRQAIVLQLDTLIMSTETHIGTIVDAVPAYQEEA